MIRHMLQGGCIREITATPLLQEGTPDVPPAVHPVMAGAAEAASKKRESSEGVRCTL